MQQRSELPEGWAFSNLNKISDDIKYGYTASSEKQAVGPHLLRITDIQDGKVDWENVPFCKINEEQISKYELRQKDIVFARTGATTGKSYLILSCPQSVFASYLIRLRPNENLDAKFLILFFNTFDYWKQISQNLSGIAQPNCNATKLKELILPLPPLAEQHRIVLAIESLFARLDATNERLDRVPDIVKKFRQSVLAAACDGRLTEAWREENPYVEDSKEYLEKIKVEKKTKSKKHEKLDDVDYPNSNIIPDKWSGVKIGEIETFIGSGITPRGGRSVYVNEGIPFIRSQNVYPKGLILDDIAYVTSEMHQKMKRTHVFSGDVLLNITGASIGRSTYVPENFREANVNQHVCIIRCGWWILPRYLSMFLNSDSGQSQIFKMQTGQTREGLNYTQIRNMFVALPPLPEQHEIVRRVDALFALADSIEAKVAAARVRTEKGRQSILAKAFSGELVETEAELARREGRDYERADVLLERIKAERGKSAKKGKAAKGKSTHLKKQ